jgi:hypothetical protein
MMSPGIPAGLLLTNSSFVTEGPCRGKKESRPPLVSPPHSVQHNDEKYLPVSLLWLRLSANEDSDHPSIDGKTPATHFRGSGPL